jgi:hypothetical protein
MPQICRIKPLCQDSRKSLIQAKKDREEKLSKRFNLIPKHDRYAAQKYEVRETDGFARLNALISTLELLDTRGYRRSKSQREFHRHYISACLKKIFGKDLHRNLVRITEMFKLTEIRSDVIVCTPRRWGKTFSVALFVAAYIWSQPGCEVSIYSTGRRASRKLLLLIRKMIVAIAGSDDCITQFNEENLEVIGMWGVASKCCSYPSKVQIDCRVSRHVTENSINLFFFCSLSHPHLFGLNEFIEFLKGQRFGILDDIDIRRSQLLDLDSVILEKRLVGIQPGVKRALVNVDCFHLLDSSDQAIRQISIGVFVDVIYHGNLLRQDNQIGNDECALHFKIQLDGIWKFHVELNNLDGISSRQLNRETATVLLDGVNERDEDMRANRNDASTAQPRRKD